MTFANITTALRRTLVPALAMLAAAALTAGSAAAQKKVSLSSVGGTGTGATVNAAPMASASLPVYGGYAEANTEGSDVPGVFTATRMTAITSGLTDPDLLGSQTTATAEGVNIMNGLVTARGVTAVAASWASGRTGGSDSDGSSVMGLVVNGVAYADEVPAPNTRIDLGNGGYVILNEQVTSSGNGRNAGTSSITVNMIHVVTKDASGNTVDVVVGSAMSQVTM